MHIGWTARSDAAARSSSGPYSLLATAREPSVKTGQPRQQRLVDGAVRLAGWQPQHLNAQGRQRIGHRGGGELQPAIDAHQGRDRAERVSPGVVDQRHPQRGQHRAGVRRQREHGKPPRCGTGVECNAILSRFAAWIGAIQHAAPVLAGGKAQFVRNIRE